MSKKQFIKSIAFILLFVFLLSGISNILSAKWVMKLSETCVLEGFYELEKNSLDVCVLGSSQVTYGLNCMEMYEDYGISAYSLGTANQPMMMTYYLAKDVIKTQNVSTILMDVSILYEESNEGQFRKVLDNMPLSRNKVEAIWAHCQEEEGESESESEKNTSTKQAYLFNIIKYHSRWQELTKEDFDYSDVRNYIYRGNNLNSDLTGHTLSYDILMIENDEPEEIEMVRENKDYFIKIVELCKSENINLILIKTPKESWTKTRHEGVAQLAEEYGLDFLDFNTEEMMKAMNLVTDEDIKDIDHLNVRGEDKLSSYLAEYMLERYEFTDYRTVEGYDPGNFEQYQKDHQDKYLQSCRNIEEFLSYLSDSRYDVMMQSSGDISGGWNEEQQKYFSDMGVSINPKDVAGMCYTVSINSGKCVFEQASETDCASDGVLSDGNPYALISRIGFADQMVVAGVPQEFKKLGLNICVYDNQMNEIVDIVTICSTEEGLELYHE